MVTSHVPPTGDRACNPGMCPDWKSNQRPFGSQASTPSTEPHQLGQNPSLFLAVLAKWQKLRAVLELPGARAGDISVYNDIKDDN